MVITMKAVEVKQRASAWDSHIKPPDTETEFFGQQSGVAVVGRMHLKSIAKRQALWSQVDFLQVLSNEENFFCLLPEVHVPVSGELVPKEPLAEPWRIPTEVTAQLGLLSLPAIVIGG